MRRMWTGKGGRMVDADRWWACRARRPHRGCCKHRARTRAKDHTLTLSLSFSLCAGKTRCINHFLINKDQSPWYLVDLPGYGYARVSKDQRVEFDQFTKEYFMQVCVCVYEEEGVDVCVCVCVGGRSDRGPVAVVQIFEQA